MDVAIEAGAEDVVHDEDEITVHTTPEMFGVVVDAMKAEGFVPELAEVTMSASVNVSLDLENAEQFMKMVEMLEDLDDVQEVYSNADISEEIGKLLA